MGSYIIYMCTFPNGKKYVGQTNRDLYTRMNEHYRDSMNLKCKKYNWPFYKALREFGFLQTDWQVLQTCENQEELNQAEKYWIKYYNTNMHIAGSNGYNQSEGGEGWSKSR